MAFILKLKIKVKVSLQCTGWYIIGITMMNSRNVTLLELLSLISPRDNLLYSQQFKKIKREHHINTEKHVREQWKLGQKNFPVCSTSWQVYNNQMWSARIACTAFVALTLYERARSYRFMSAVLLHNLTIFPSLFLFFKVRDPNQQVTRKAKIDSIKRE